MKSTSKLPYTGRVLVEEIDSGLVSPGETYHASCRAPEPLFINEVLVRDFTLVELYVGNCFVETRGWPSVAGARAYRLLPTGMTIRTADELKAVLVNKTDRPLQIRFAEFEQERRT